MKYQKFAGKYSTSVRLKDVIISPVQSGYNPRETKQYSSLQTAGGSTALKDKKEYTGTAMLGVTVLHKSNLVPIFNEQAAKDSASMRR